MASSHAKNLSILSGSLHGLRFLPGAIHTIFLIERGVSFQNLALLQMVFSATVLCVSYPAGILINRYGGKFFTIISCFCIFSYNVFCLFAPNFLILILANTIYAFGLTFMASSTPIWRTSWAWIEGHLHPNYINYLGHLENEYQAIWSIISGSIGTLLPFFWGENGYIILYFLTAIVMLTLAVLFEKIPSKNQQQNIPLKQNVLRDIKLIKYPSIFYFLCLSGIITVIYQPVFHFWQPLIHNFYSPFSIDQKLIMGICFFCVNISCYFSNYWVKRYILKNSNINLFYFSLIIFLFSSLLFIFLGIAARTIVEGILCFSILHGLLSIGSKIITSQYLKIPIHGNSASILSLGEMLGRGAGFFSYQ